MPIAAAAGGLAAALSAGAAVVGTAATVAFGIKGMMAQKKAMAMQNKLNNIRAARERMSQFRQARIARGQIANQAALANVMGASSPEAGMGSVGSQLASNLSFIDQQLALQGQINSLTGKAQQAEGWANLFQGAASGVSSVVRSLSNPPSQPPTIAPMSQFSPASYQLPPIQLNPFVLRG